MACTSFSVKSVGQGIFWNHIYLYRNCDMLCKLHPSLATEKLKKCLTKTMFAVTDISGFQQVMHFLLSILNAEKCNREYWWPIYDKQMESKFRQGVRTILHELRVEYPHQDFLNTNLTASFLTNPGGRKFVTFMQNLSRFVLLFGLKSQQDFLDIMVPSNVKSQHYKCINILESAAVYKRKENESTHSVTLFLQYEAEKKARLLSNKLAASWVKLEKLKFEKENVKETVLNASDENSLGNSVHEAQELDWREQANYQYIVKICTKIIEHSKKMEMSCNVIQSAVAVDPSSSLFLDGSKLGFNLSSKHFDSSPQLKYLLSKVYIDNKIVLTTVMAMACEWFSILHAALKKKNVQALRKNHSHLALEKLSHVLDQNVSATDEMYSVLVNLAPVVHHKVENIVQINKSDERVWNLMYEVFDLVSSPPFTFNVESTLNSTKNNYEKHTLHITPVPNRFKSFLKGKINNYVTVTPNVKLANKSSVSEGLKHASTASKSKHSGLKSSAIPVPKSTKHTSVSAKYGLDRVTNSPSHSFPNFTLTKPENILQSSIKEQSIDNDVKNAIDESLFSPLNCSEMIYNRSIQSTSLSFNTFYLNDSLSDSDLLKSQTDLMQTFHESSFVGTITPAIKPRTMEQVEVPEVLCSSASTLSMSPGEKHLPKSNISTTHADNSLTRTPSVHPNTSTSNRRRSLDRVIERYRQIKALQVRDPPLLENSEI